MNELVALGVSQLEVIRMVTSNAAEMLRLADSIGTLGVGRQADVSIVALEAGDFVLKDSSGVSVASRMRFRPEFVVQKGRVLEIVSPLLPITERPVNRQVPSDLAVQER
jgi:dihydroorotase